MRHERDGFSVEAAKIKGRPLPEWYVNQPEFVPEFQWIMDAFWQLVTCRPTPESLIPWTAVRAWADRENIPEDIYPALVLCIRKLDLALHEWNRKKPSSETTAPKTKPSRKPKRRK